jgi:hypothetical protein
MRYGAGLVEEDIPQDYGWCLNIRESLREPRAFPETV